MITKCELDYWEQRDGMHLSQLAKKKGYVMEIRIQNNFTMWLIKGEMQL